MSIANRRAGTIVAGFLVVAFLLGSGAAQSAGSGEITLIHMGDVHGHLVPRPNLRSDGAGRMEGGLARMYALIADIRARRKHTLLLNTGDTIQGSAEALFTRGQGLVDVVNEFGVDAFAPGNWEFVYGTDRFLEFFAGDKPKAPWGTIAANVYYDGEPYAEKTGQLVLPPFVVREVGGLRIGIFGLTTRRGPQVSAPRLRKPLHERRPGGARLRADPARAAEGGCRRDALRAGAREQHPPRRGEPGDRRRAVVRHARGDARADRGEDRHAAPRGGAGRHAARRATLTVRDGKVTDRRWTQHTIDDRIRPNARVAARIAAVRKTFVSGPSFTRHVNPFNGTRLARPIDTVVGQTKIPLHRSNFAHEGMAAVIEGSSHDFLTDAFRQQAKADIGAIRGFRYGTHVAPGPIRMEDLYHFVAIGPLIARGTIRGQQVKNQVENAAEGSFSPHVQSWTGGWLFNFSGVTMD
jgi:2',3'-cyclic-nucleotide 2'-phosphodiesterase (5'-nucleotidase family)